MQNTNNFNALKAGTVIASPEARLGWTANKSQPITYSGKTGKVIYGNRAVIERDGKYFVKSRSKQEVQVVKLDDGKYEVICD